MKKKDLCSWPIYEVDFFTLEMSGGSLGINWCILLSRCELVFLEVVCFLFFHYYHNNYIFNLSKEDENEAEGMEVDKKPLVTETPEAANTAESPANHLETPVPVTQATLPLSLQFLRLGHEALGG